MNGFTGLDPILAKQNIKAFADDMTSVYSKTFDVFDNFGYDLSYCWASPNAVDFNNIANPMVENLMRDIVTKMFSIIDGATRAYNIVAGQHGVERISSDSDMYLGDSNTSNTSASFIAGGTGYNPFVNVENRDGVTGININVVRDHLLPAFKNSISNITDAIESLPTSIALYDDENGQKHSYETGISNIRESILSTVDSILASINTALSNEVDNTLLAKQQATDAMSTNA